MYRKAQGKFCPTRAARSCKPCPTFARMAKTVGELMGAFRATLAEGSHGEFRAIISAVFKERAGIAHPGLVPERALTAEQARALENDLAKLAAGQPLQYVLGHVPFHGLQLKVDPRVLIPRPETEELVELISRRPAPGRIFDVGTGSGCIALALKRSFPDTEVSGIDASSAALELAAENARLNNLQIEWLDVDALGPVFHEVLQKPVAGRTFVVSNPPYVPQTEAATLQPTVRDHEPSTALFVPDNDPQLFYRAIAGAAYQAFRPGDELWFEGHYRHATGTAALLAQIGFAHVNLLHDLSGNPRFIHAWK